MTTSHRRRITVALAACLLSGAAIAQSFPSKTVTIVVPFPPGGGPDLLARVLAEKLAPKLGQAVVVDNKPGAGGLLGASGVAKAAADGHTLLLSPNTLVISPHVLPKGAGAGLDVQKDLVPVIAPVSTPMVLVANPTLGVSNLAQLIALAKKQPGLPYASTGNGSPMHFAGEMFKKSAGVDLLHVPYRGTGPALTAVLGGEVKLLYIGLGGAAAHIKAGKLIPLAVTEKARAQMFPQLLTAAEQGVKDVEVNAWFGLFAPAGTPASVVTRLNKEVNDALQLADVREKLLQAGLEVIGGSPQVLAGFIKEDDQRYSTIARDLGIKAD
ncbi:MAG: tripartite tricarboxylate transporter substrate binding protein [Burkholderiaceae bacterium]